MRKKTAKQLIKSIEMDLPDSAAFELIESKTVLPLSGFHTFADGLPCLGAFLIESETNQRLWLLVIDWKDIGNFYVVIYPEKRGASPIAELHNQISGHDSVDLAWKYQPRKQDGSDRNDERKAAFIQAAGSLEFVVSMPSAIITLDDFLLDLFNLKALRIAADNLTQCGNFTNKSSFPEGRRIERMHKSRERDSAVVRQAKARHSQIHNNKLPCEVCGFEFSRHYGAIGEGYIEAHHTRPLSELAAGEICHTRLEDLALVCANCHRMLHRRRPWASISDIKKRLRK